MDDRENFDSGMQWQVIGEAVQGAQHIAQGRECQDWIDWCSTKTYHILAVSDGHGSSYFGREGARIAVEVAINVFEDVIRQRQLLQENYNVLREQLPRSIVRRWRQKVLDWYHHSGEYVLPPNDAGNSDKSDKGLTEQEIIRQFGCTLITVALSGQVICYLQIGDGDILAVSPDRQVVAPLPDDDLLIANETTSLCLPSAELYFRFRIIPFGVFLPQLIMVSTDGYVNSFATREDFEQAALDYLDILSKRYVDVSQSLSKWLQETSAKGSGDDIAVGLIYRPKFE